MRNYDRRQLITRGVAASTVGITAAVLPSAVSAVSGAGTESIPTPEDRVIAAWSVGNVADRFTSLSSTIAAPSGDAWVTSGSTITGTMGIGGSFYGSLEALNAAPVGLAPYSDNRTWMYAKNPAASIDVTNSLIPYWFWAITAGAVPVDFGFMYLGFNSSSNTVMSLRSNIDSYATSIRDFAGTNGSYAAVKIDLSGQPVLAAGATRTFRLYVRTDASSQFIMFTGGANPGLTGADSWDDALGGANFGFIHA